LHLAQAGERQTTGVFFVKEQLFSSWTLGKGLGMQAPLRFKTGWNHTLRPVFHH
jgi:hypothetical protein